ncbi:MAG: hypothetical protein JOY66_18180 [Acetobacteraceae bacterium]|nr:hypothetical protein [Acetobacteraceae bacterium]
MSDPLRLAELVVTRVLHDVGGLAGTLAATIELALEEAGAGGESLTSAADLSAELNRRVRLLRSAWGPTGEALDVGRLQDLALGTPGAHRMRLDLSALPKGRPFSPEVSRVLLNVIILAAQSLPLGGTLTLAPAGEAGVTATIRGRRAAWPERLAASLGSEAAAWSALDNPRGLIAPLAALIAHRLGVPLALAQPTRVPRRRGPPPLLIGAAPAPAAS